MCKNVVNNKNWELSYIFLSFENVNDYIVVLLMWPLLLFAVVRALNSLLVKVIPREHYSP